MRAKLKLACSGLEDKDFTDFLNTSLRVPERKALLESHYCTELALYSILRGELDRAKFYNDSSLQLFLQVSIRVCTCIRMCVYMYVDVICRLFCKINVVIYMCIYVCLSFICVLYVPTYVGT